MSSILMKVAIPASVIAKDSDLPIEPGAIAQVVTTAVTGNAIKSLEEAVRCKIPYFVTDRPNMFRSHHTQYPHFALIDRATKVLRSVLPAIDPLTLDFRAQKLVNIIIEEVERQGLQLHTQPLLFAQEFAKNGLKILKGLAHEKIPPVRASVAIASKVISAPPSNSTKEHLLYLGPQKPGLYNIPTFANWVAGGKTFLIEFPLPNIKVGDDTRIDEYDENGGGSLSPHPGSAILGLGFFVVRPEKMPPSASSPLGRSYFHVLTPILTFRAGQTIPWRLNHLRTITVFDGDRNRAYEDLAKLLRPPRPKDLLRSSRRTFVATLQVCSACLEIYSEDRADLNKHCSCARKDPK